MINSLKPPQRARVQGGVLGPPLCARIGGSLPASAGQLSSRPLGNPRVPRRCPGEAIAEETSGF
jgi:hypothetical protein